MKTFLTIILVSLIYTSALARFTDDDGILSAKWEPPTTGNPVDHYVLQYKVNGIDSFLVETSNVYDSSIVLSSVGDSATYDIYAVSIFGDTSITVSSDYVVYDLGTGIGPPTGITWQ